MNVPTRTHRIPAAAHRLVEQPVLRVEGHVARPCDLTVEDLDGLPRYDLDETFTCDDERAALGQRWRGVRVADWGPRGRLARDRFLDAEVGDRRGRNSAIF